MKKIFWGVLVHPTMEYFRKRRAKRILSIAPDFNNMRICDIGGSRHYWEKVYPVLDPKSLTILNVTDGIQSTSYTGRFKDLEIQIFDGQRIPYPDQYFDIIVCNSVIEHVPKKNRALLLNEIERCAKLYFIQTPAIIFPIEPHFMMPFVHWLPRPISKILVRFGLYNIITRPERSALNSYFDEVELLSLKEFRNLLPNSKVDVERFFYIPKSYTLYRAF
jgi:hypothetical protein